jgi:excinuclease ABC subunit B
MERAMNETNRRREKQLAYNEAHGITPTTIRRNIGDIIKDVSQRDQVTVEIDEDRPHMVGHNLRAYIEELERRMRKAAGDLEFEEAGRLRDEIRSLEAEELGLPVDDRKAPVMGRSNEGKPGTRKTRYGKSRKMRGGMPGSSRRGR